VFREHQHCDFQHDRSSLAGQRQRPEDQSLTIAERDAAAPSPRGAHDLARSGTDPLVVARRRFFLVGFGSVIVVTVAFLVRALVYTHGHLVYAIDDAGIHLAIARNLVQHGTWGVSPGVYESASSSPGWTLILAAVQATVPALSSVAPLVLNLVGAAWILWIFSRWQSLTQMTRGHRMSWAFVVLMPLVALFLPGLAFAGMEHSLHAAVILQTFVLLSALVEGTISRRGRWAYFALLAVGSILRLETMFVAAGCALAILAAPSRRLGGDEAARRWPVAERLRYAVCTGLCAGVPIAVIAAINLAFGQRVFPNSVVAKSALGGSRRIIPGWYPFLQQLVRDPLLAGLLLLATAYVIYAFYGYRGKQTAFAIAFAVAVLLHVCFADIGSFERYQAYLIVAGLLLAMRAAEEVVTPHWREAALGTFMIAIVLLSATRLDLLFKTPLASSNTYRQQYQVGRFFHRYYEGKPVAVNDLGYASYLHDGPIVDLIGLGSKPVLDARRAGHFNRAFVDRFFRDRGVQAIALYFLVYANVIPFGWRVVGNWSLGQARVSPLFNTVTFYAPDEARAVLLDRHLREFAPSLPRGVVYQDRATLVRAQQHALQQLAPGS
jgi:hypothetical protein